MNATSEGLQKPYPIHRMSNRLSSWLLICGFSVALFSLAGYATFGLHPGWLRIFPEQYFRFAMAFYQVSFRFFGEGQSWLLVGLFVIYLSQRVGWRWCLSFVVVYSLSLGAELLGTTKGIPFGFYKYTPLMGATWWGHVPFVIPASWWMMAVPAYAMAAARFPEQKGKIILLGALWLTLWDVSLDPAMSYLTLYWQWQTPGGFYGMPLQNWVGWYLTSLVLMGALHFCRIDRWLAQIELRWFVLFYGLNLMIPFGMLLIAGVWGAVLVNLIVVGGCMWLWRPPQLLFQGWQIRWVTVDIHLHNMHSSTHTNEQTNGTEREVA